MHMHMQTQTTWAMEGSQWGEQDSSDRSTAPASTTFSSTRSNASSLLKMANADIDNDNTQAETQSHRKKRGKIILIHPPSAFHPDIYPPSLARVQRALRSHHRQAGPCFLVEQGGHIHVSSRSPDEQGGFVLEGSSRGYYVGDVLGGLPHGFGKHYIPLPSNGKMHLLYDGEWAYGTKTGKGNVFYTNGEEYRGDLRQNLRWGSGWMRYKDGSLYDGDWLRGRRHGVGLQCHKDGNCYYGSFCKDFQDGWGTLYWQSIMQKFEGEWMINKPYSGSYSPMDANDLKEIQARLSKVDGLAAVDLFCGKSCQREIEMVQLNLQNPMWIIFEVICELRAQRACEFNSKALFKTQVGRNENLSAVQLKILKKTFEVIVPMVDRKAKLPVVHLRRLLVLACIDPDTGQGKKLLEHLQRFTKEKLSIGFDELLLYIMQYHYP